MESFLDAEKNDIIKLKSDEGRIIEFILVETIELKGKKYFLLTPEDENDETLEYEGIYIFQLKVKGDNEYLVIVDDEDIMDAVYDEYEKIAGVELGVYEDEEFEN